MKLLYTLFLGLISSYSALSATSKGALSENYDVVWTEQSRNSSESMPCGGGSIGLNVWVENNELMFYLSRSGTFDENNVFLKLGRVRVSCSPNPFEGATFRQELHLQDGYVSVEAEKGKDRYRFDIWADVNSPIVHVDFAGSRPVKMEIQYESWRHNNLVWTEPGRIRANIAYRNAPIKAVIQQDSIDFQGNKIEWYHQNRSESIWDITIERQGLGALKSILWNPLQGSVFGGSLQGKGLVRGEVSEGKYIDTPFRAWSLNTPRAVNKQSFEVVLHSDSVSSAQEWKTGLNELQKTASSSTKKSRIESRKWWNDFWQRSYIVVNENETDKGHEVGRNYQLFRYQLGCNAYGEYPSKFNGGMFTYDPSLVKGDAPFTPDHRDWGGGTHTAQNQRLLYWPMLKSGDFEMMRPQIEFYRRSLKNAELRTQSYWGHNGASFSEQIDQWGLPMMGSYGWNRPSTLPAGIEDNNWVEHQWDTSLEFCLMILDIERFANQNIEIYIPLIESCLTFFDEHYQWEALHRGKSALDQKGKLIIYPGTACETYKLAYNPSSTIAALQSVATRLLELEGFYLSAEKRKHWEGFLQRIPKMPFRTMKGKKTIAPAEAWARISNMEIPQLYPVFPWGLYGVGLPDLQIAIDTWKHGVDQPNQRGYVSWHQDPIFCARLGLTDEARELTVKKLENSPRRFPTFWGPGHDWIPDHNWGGSGMIALQEMLLQTPGRQIILFPAWPKEWNVRFKLHAPYQTIVEGEWIEGKIKSLKVTPEERRKDLVVGNPQ